MLILMDRIGRAVVGVLAVAGIVIAINSQQTYIALMLALIVVALVAFTVMRERSRTVTRAKDWLQRRDPSAVVFVSRRPSRTAALDHYAPSESPVALPSIFPVAVNAMGISYFSTDKVPVALVSIPWSDIGDVVYSDAWSDTKEAVLDITIADGSHLVFEVRSLVKGTWDTLFQSPRELISDIEAARTI